MAKVRALENRAPGDARLRVLLALFVEKLLDSLVQLEKGCFCQHCQLLLWRRTLQKGFYRLVVLHVHPAHLNPDLLVGRRGRVQPAAYHLLQLNGVQSGLLPLNLLLNVFVLRLFLQQLFVVKLEVSIVEVLVCLLEQLDVLLVAHRSVVSVLRDVVGPMADSHVRLPSVLGLLGVCRCHSLLLDVLLLLGWRLLCVWVGPHLHLLHLRLCGWRWRCFSLSGGSGWLVCWWHL